MENEEDTTKYLTSEDIKYANAMSTEINKLSNFLTIMSRFETIEQIFNG